MLKSKHNGHKGERQSLSGLKTFVAVVPFVSKKLVLAAKLYLD